MSNTSLLGAYGDNSGSALMFRNKLINGAFDVWQRGTSFGAITPIYMADRWLTRHAGIALTCNYLRNNADGQWNGAKFYQRIARTVGTGMTEHSIEQRIEGVHTLSGSQATVSFDCRDITGTRTLSVRLIQNFGSGGSAAVSIPAQTVSVPTGTTPQRRVLTFTIPSVVSKTIGTDDYLSLIFDFPLTENFQLDISNIQLEEGVTATPFERRQIAAETALCQRYFYKTTDWIHSTSAIAPGGAYGAHIFNFTFPVTLRKVPTFTVDAISNGGTGTNYTVPDFLSKVSQTYRSTTNAYLEMNVSALAGTVTSFLMLNGMQFNAEL